MRFFLLKVLCFLALFSCGTQSLLSENGTTKNLFVDLLGVAPSDVDLKIDAVWDQLFFGDNDMERVYYPVEDGMGYIADIGSQDVRSEGMSYGMMIAVQLDKKEVFDRLWKWARTHMYHEEGGRSGYFAWHCDFDGKQLSEASASDGEEWFAMALYFAAGRWGNGEGVFDYQKAADQLLHDMVHKKGSNGYLKSIFHPIHKMPVFVPHGEYAEFTDPSYHLPAFYELWADWAPEDNDLWKECASISREFLKKAAHPETGLMPDYAHFDGSARLQDDHKDFRFDAWRNFANVAIDWHWHRADPWQVEQSNRVLAFLAKYGSECPNQLTLDGKPLSNEISLGLYAMAAVAGLASEPELAQPVVAHLWNAEIPEGKWRYYDGLMYFLGLLQTAGEFQIYSPVD